MRIATWNLEKGGSKRARALQDLTLDELAADVLVLTEPSPSFAPAGHAGSAPWVVIHGRSVTPLAIDVPCGPMATAAGARENGRKLLIYGSVLPWSFMGRQHPQLSRPGESADHAFLRVLREQVDDIRRLRAGHPAHDLVWAGDFNQTVSGPNYGSSEVRRRALLEALAELHLNVWNADAPSARPGMHTIDLLCGSRELLVMRTGRIDPVRDGVVMSDHAGYWVALELGRPT